MAVYMTIGDYEELSDDIKHVGDLLMDVERASVARDTSAITNRAAEVLDALQASDESRLPFLTFELKRHFGATLRHTLHIAELELPTELELRHYMAQIVVAARARVADVLKNRASHNTV